ncbi:MAG TPA: Glu/Leu/Phe/Val dehydrogenase dimerization domain-containing protein [Pyrinomonadaceae bacterium]|nr:Glu/Leu/Phe/Val dehydrogenase dimerization domain-containing protein [Pyrinomonadaceae bacterium]
MQAKRQLQQQIEHKNSAGLVQNWTVSDLLRMMELYDAERAFVIYRDGDFISSHPEMLNPVQAFLETSNDFDEHEGVFFGRENGVDTVFFAFVHNTKRGLAQGGLRFMKYGNIAALLSDGLRLSRGMTRKNALADLWWGGGKGIMPLPVGYGEASQIKDPVERRRLFEAYGRFVASLDGLYYTAEDMGTSPEDMKAVHSVNRFTTCIPAEIGGSGNPSPFTARGVFRAIEAAWTVLKGSKNLLGVKVAVQGAGNVGTPLVCELADSGAEVWVADVPAIKNRLEELKRDRPNVHIVDNPDEVYDLDVDIFSPCWRGAVINQTTIPRLKAKLICGAANNILSEEADADRLKARGIEYVPDYVCNRMGIVNCADEWMGYLPEDISLAADRVYPDTLKIFDYARGLNITTAEAANQLADKAAGALHPIMGHRGRRIIEHLLKSDWAGLFSKGAAAA